MVAEPVVTPVPRAPAVVLGLINVRGAVVPVLDAGLLLDDEPVGDASFVVVVDTARGTAGLAVADMPTAADVDEADLTDPDAVVSR